MTNSSPPKQTDFIQTTTKLEPNRLSDHGKSNYPNVEEELSIAKDLPNKHLNCEPDQHGRQLGKVPRPSQNGSNLVAVDECIYLLC